MAVIPMLAVIPLLAIGDGPAQSGGHGGGGSLEGLPGWAHALTVLGAVGAIVLGGRFLTRPCFRFIAKTGLRDIFSATALMLVIGIALLMQSVGLSPALGTFLGGVVLAESEFRHELESNIEPFKGLLLGLFFISVGAGIDFGLLFNNPLYIFGITLTLIVLKFVILLILGRTFKLAAPEGFLFAFALAQGGEFAFVLISFAIQNHAMPGPLGDTLIVAVALSMLATPLLLLLHEHFIAQKLFNRGRPDQPDVIAPEGPVIIAGFGRFGQMVGRLLIANDFPVTVLDHSADQIEMVRRFGYKVYYGDASRMDLLEAAGIKEAALFVVAIDDREKALALVTAIRHQYPDLKILARAFDRPHAYALIKEGAHVIKRETMDAALELGAVALQHLGFRAFQARRALKLFKKHDESSLYRLAPLWGDETSYFRATQDSKSELDKVLERDKKHLYNSDGGSDWHSEPLS